MQQLSRNKRSIVSFRLLIKDNMNFSQKKKKKKKMKKENDQIEYGGSQKVGKETYQATY